MKKLIACILSLTLVFSAIVTVSSAATAFVVTGGTILDGADDAPISSRVTYELSSDIGSADNVTLVKNGTTANLILSTQINEKKLVIKLKAELSYGTNYTLDLSPVRSTDGSALRNGIIKFKTKSEIFATGVNNSYSILEDDFEFEGSFSNKWRTEGVVSGVAVKSSAENEGNIAAKLAPKSTDPKGSQLSNYGVKYMAFQKKAVFDFDILFENVAYGNNDVETMEIFKVYISKSKSYGGGADTKTESGNLLKYDSGYLSVAESGATKVNVGDSWTHVRIIMDISNQKYKTYINDTLIKASTGQPDFTIPNSGSANIPWNDEAYLNLAAFILSNTASNYDGSVVYVDNISYRGVPATGTTASYGIDNNAVLENVVQPIDIKFTNEIETLDLKLNEISVNSASEIAQLSEKKFIYNKAGIFDWGQSYTLTGTAKDIYGDTCNINLSFSVRPQPNEWIEYLGFYKDSTRLDSLQAGNIGAKLRVWTLNPQSYMYILASYKEDGGYIAMQSMSCDSLDYSSGAELDIPAIAVSDDAAYIKLYIFDSLTSRRLADKTILCGSDTLK